MAESYLQGTQKHSELDAGMKKSSKKVKKGKKVTPHEPPIRAGHIMTKFDDGSVCISGGYSAIGPLDDLWVFGNTDQWSQLITIKQPLSPFPRMMFDGCVINGCQLYIVAGIVQENDQVLILNDIWTLQKSSGDQYTWTCLHEECSVPERHSHVVVGISGGRMMIHGGECVGFLNDCWLYDTLHQSFTQIPTPAGASPCPRASHSAVYCEPFVVMFGGVTSTTSISLESTSLEESGPVYLNDLWLWDTTEAHNSWRMVTLRGIAPSPRDLPAVVDVGALTGQAGDILIFGGYGLYTTDDSVNDGDDMDMSGRDGNLPENTCNDDDQDRANIRAASGRCVAPEDVAVTAIDMSMPSSGISNTATSGPDNVTAYADSGSGSLALGTLRTALLQSAAVAGSGDVGSGADVARGGNDEDNDVSSDSNESVLEGYLKDSWVINIYALNSREVDICCGSHKDRDDLAAMNTMSSAMNSGRRGAKIVALLPSSPSTGQHNYSEVQEGKGAVAEECVGCGRLMISGGFDGEKFGGVIDNMHIV